MHTDTQSKHWTTNGTNNENKLINISLIWHTKSECGIIYGIGVQSVYSRVCVCVAFKQLV